MAKHRKTRREKKVADQRHDLYHIEQEPAQERPSIEKNEAITPTYKISTPKTKTVASYGYVITDIRRALLVSSVIIVSQIVLYFYLNKI